jgi:alginate O-acetyltransferase complex protein AlgI
MRGGYSDMAIGLGRMLGFHFLENFNYPYIAQSITEFWRRWHISLSTFFRDYVYIPLGGNRVAKLRCVLNLLIVWFLTGMWHGASWNFICWGLYYGFILLLEKLVLNKKLASLPALARHLYVILLFILGWVFFRMGTVTAIGHFMGALFGGYGAGRLDPLILTQILQPKYILAFIAGIIGASPFVSNLFAAGKENRAISIIRDALLVIVFLLSVNALLMGSFTPFIYAQF